jgi:membrane protease subunit HflK
MQDKLGGLFGGGRSRSRPGGGEGTPYIGLIVVAGLILLLLFEMFYRIEPAERGVVLRFGKYVTILQPGPHLRFPRPIEEVIKVNVEQIRRLTVHATMLTGDENIVDVEVAIQYRINDVTDYLFKIADPDDTVQRVAESSVREMIGRSTLDFVITEGRAEIGQQVKERLQETVDHYTSGIEITSVNMQPAKPPEEVKAAFDDAIRAREDEQRRINEAEAYRNEVVEKAAGEAGRIRLNADAYKEQVIAESEGEASRFEQLLAEYEKAPVVTRRRLYLEAVEEVLAGSSKVMLDSKGGGNSLMYLPLDKLMEGSRTQFGPSSSKDLLPEGADYPKSQESASRDRTEARMRGIR